jgi:hypothetical protein
MRKYAYRYSEGRAAHWLILVAADRVDALQSNVRSFLTLHPDNPITETGVLSEYSYHGIRSRLGQNRADLRHQVLDPIVIGAPWAIRLGVAALGIKTLVKRVRGRKPAAP